MSSRKIRLLLDSGTENFVKRIGELPEAADFELVSYVGQGPQAVNALVQDVDAAYMYQDELTGAAIRAAPRLRFIQKHGVNCKNIDMAAAAENGIPVATLPLFRSVAVAEQAMALMLACAHKIIPAHASVVGGAYQALGLEPVRTEQRKIRPNWSNIANIVELMHTSVGIVGLGDIGMEIAKRCSAFGMRILYHQRTPHIPAIEKEYQAQYLPLDDLLREVDYLVLVLPLTPHTEGMIGARELSLMKPTATLINVARGPVVDEDALADALARGTIAMAGLDVFRDEPLPITSPLISLPNVVLTPHNGGGSYKSLKIDHRAGITNIVRFFSGAAVEGVTSAP